MRLPILFAALLGLATFARAQNAPTFPPSTTTSASLAAQGMFPFAPPPLDDAPGGFDLSSLNEKPAGKSGFVHASGENFVDGSGRKIRFWGVNLNFEGVFPDKSLAPRIAGRLAKFGFNSVRLHQFDNGPAPRGIWKAASPTTARVKIPREIDPAQLDKFDFFASELIKRGLYLDLNLHVGRKLVEDEIPGAAQLPDKDKGIAALDERVAAPNRDFARLLLLHVNPYTGRAYKDEPGVCALEVDNESSVLANYLDGSLNRLPPAFAAPLRQGWNGWLRQKYGSSAALSYAWSEVDWPLSGVDLLRPPTPPGVLVPAQMPRYEPGAPLILGQSDDDLPAATPAAPPENPQSPPGITSPGITPETLASLDKWKLNLAGGAAGRIARDDLGGPAIDGFVQPGLTLNLTRAGGVSWAFQLVRDGLTIEDGKPYTLTFWGRSDSARGFGVNLWQDEKPFGWLGYTGLGALSNDWQKFTFTLRATGASPGHVRIALNLGSAAGGVQFGNFSLQSGGKIAVPANYLSENGAPIPDAKTEAIAAVRRDFAAYLGELETKNLIAMRRFLVLELGVRVPIWHTQAQFGGWGGAIRERLSDAIDTHVYWKHPDFGGAGWNGANWRVENQSMAANPLGDPLGSIAMLRVPGKPMTISEFNSGQPNDFGAESLPMLAAMAAYQNVAGAWIFDYHSTGSYERDHFENYFSIDAQPVKMATAPMAALIFRRPNDPLAPPLYSEASAPEIGDIAPASDEITLNLPPKVAWSEVANAPGPVALAPFLKTWSGSGAPRGAGLNGRAGNSQNPGLFASPSLASNQNSAVFGGANGEIQWDGARATWSLNAARAKMVAGAVGGRKIQLGDAQFWVAPSSNWATIGLVSLDNAPIAGAKNLLLTLAGKAENVGMKWNSDRSSVGAQWGSGPTYAQGISATIKVLTDARTARVWALDERGQKRGQLDSSLQNGALKFEVSPVWRTLWYQIELG